jgi:hypothetical protein
VVNFKTRNYLLPPVIYLYTTALILFIHIGFLEYLSFTLKNGITVPKDLFTLYVNVKIVTAKIFWPP